jgi:hypothetical protein
VTSARCMNQLRHVSAEIAAHPRARELRERLEAARTPSAEVRTCTGAPAVAVLMCRHTAPSGPKTMITDETTGVSSPMTSVATCPAPSAAPARPHHGRPAAESGAEL